MAEQTLLPRRVAWGMQGAPQDPRARIIAAAASCIASLGVERTSLTAIAKQANVSRQTIYKYFANKDEIVIEAVRHEATSAAERIMTSAQNQVSAAAFVVETAVAAHFEFTQNPAISPFFSEPDRVDFRARLLTSDTFNMVRHFLEPILDYHPEKASEFDDIIETFLRFHLSLLTYESGVTETPDALRAYLHKVMVPAMGLPSAS